MSKAPIAIIGIATELPSGEHTADNLGHDDFYDFLMEQKESYEPIPLERLNIEEWKGKGLGKINASHGSFMKNVGFFDPTEFGIAAKDARAMGVSTRRLVELSFLALLDSGIDFRGKNVGCYASGTAFDIQSVAEPDELEPKGSLAGIPCMVANKISYHLDLRGPSVPVDTACSSSGVGTHLAVQAIRDDECDVAVVAGCQLNLRASDFSLYTQASILSPDGKCKPFDAGGNGFGRAEGAAVIVLKRLDQAIKDKDHIYGTILGTGISSCGSLAPVNAPVAEAQANAMERAFVGTGRAPGEVDYVEVHGTGTAAGDPTEANWVGEKFARDDDLLIGSVKGNIGHMEITSFLASLSKVLSIFKTKVVPPQVNLKRRNPAIHWDEFRLHVPIKATKLEPRHESGKLLVSMCSSGIGGVNAHAVLESPPVQEVEESTSLPEGPVLLLASGLSPRSTTAVSEDIAAVLKDKPELAIDYSIVYGRRARQMNWRSFGVQKPGDKAAAFSAPVLSPRSKPPITFLFSGQGPQHLNMGRQLFQTYPVFRQSILDLDAVYIKRTGKSMIQDYGLFDTAPNAQKLPAVWSINLIIPSITMVHLALYDLIVSLGVKPDVLIGHSAGEVALLYASGAGSKEMAFEIAIARGEAMVIVEEQLEGTMAAVSCSAEDAHRLVNSVRARSTGDNVLDIACYNSPEAVALAGHTVLIDEAVELASKAGFMAKKIMTRVPIHSRAMDICEKEYRAAILDVFERYPGELIPKVKTYSTCSGDVLDKFDAEYFWINTRNPVMFTSTMTTLTEAHAGTFVVEMSAHPVLASYVQELGVASTSLVCPMRRSKNITPHMEAETLLTALGRIASAGYNDIDLSVLYGRSGSTPRVATPAYPFVKKHIDYWPEVSRTMHRQMNPRRGPLGFPDLRINVGTHPELADHLINSEPIMPAAGFIEMGLELGARSLWKVKFHSILSLSSATPPLVDVSTDGSKYTVRSRAPPGAPLFFDHDVNNWRLHADGYFSTKAAGPGPEALDLGKIKGRSVSYDIDGFYQYLKSFAQYGPSFRRVDEVFIGSREALVRIKGVDANLALDGKYILHPAILDSCFHACVHPLFTKVTDPNIYFLPDSANSVVLHDEFDFGSLAGAEHVYAHITFKTWNPDNLVYDISLVNHNGVALCTLQGFTVARLFQVPPQEVDTRYELQYQVYNIVAPPAEIRDSGLGSNEGSPGKEVEINSKLLSRSQEIVDYIVAKAGKKVLRILELHSPGAALIGKNLAESVLQAGGLHPLYTVASTDSKSVPADAVPARHTVIEYQWGAENATALPTAVDLIVGVAAFDSADEETLKLLNSLLVPGGSLLLAISKSGSTEEYFTSSSSLATPLGLVGFDAITVSRATSTDYVVEARRPAIPATLLTISSLPAKTHDLLEYAIGKEIQLQARLRAFDETYSAPIWIAATEGPDAHAFSGFFRTLVREFPYFNLRGATFASSFSEPARKFIVNKYLPQTGEENEFVIEDSLRITVPRIVPLSNPSLKGLKTIVGPVAADEVVIQVEASAPSEAGLWGVVGVVLQSSAQALVGRRVVGVTTTKPNGKVQLHQGSISPLSEKVDAHTFARAASVAVICGLVLGLNVLNDASRFKSRVILTHSDEPAGQLANALLKTIGLTPTLLKSEVTAADLFNVNIQCNDVVLTGLAKSDQLLASYLPCGAQAVHWGYADHNLVALQRDPYLAGDILNVFAKSWPESSFILELSRADALSSVTPSAATPTTIFDPKKAYLLIGGVGSFGPFAALWLYQRGARHIILTSRSGRKTMEKMPDCLPARVFKYLEERPDLYLGVEAADGSSPSAMKKLIDSTTLPLGGVLLLATIFEDRLFFQQDEQSFKRSFQSKVGTFDALEQATDISKLDFIVSLSSITIWGNPAQTNYTSANTALDGRLKRYKNAFSIAAPAINDTSSMVRSVDETQASHLSYTACSPAELCAWIEDGILKLADKKFDVYVPPYSFNVVNDSLGPSVIYAHLLEPEASGKSAGPTEDIEATLSTLVTQFVDVSADEFSPEVPLTSYGLDSISAGRLSYALKPYLVISQMQLLSDMTLSDLVTRARKALAVTSSGSGEASGESARHDIGEAAAEMDALVRKFSLGFNENAPKLTGPFLPNPVVLVTGTTGGLGSYLLSELLQDPKVTRVIAFNRPSSTSTLLERQRAAFADRALDPKLLESSKLTFIEGDTSKLDLGVDAATYEMLQKETTAIIDNAWRLDLNAPLKVFTPNIASTRNLLDLALSSPNAASIRYAFISSIASTQNWIGETGGKEEVPEDILKSAREAAMFGYGESKYVAEKIVSLSGLQASVYRVGQLSGASDTGAWTVKEWIPKITKTSIALNVVPDMGGIISWIPMNKVAPIVLEITLDPSNTPPPVALSVIHPRPVTWTSVMNNMLKTLQPLREGAEPMKMMPFTEWMKTLETVVSSAGDKAAERYPAFALLDRMIDFAASSPPMEDNFGKERIKECGGWPWLSMGVVLGASPTMRGLLDDSEVLGERHVAAWVKYWQEQGLLPLAA